MFGISRKNNKIPAEVKLFLGGLSGQSEERFWEFTVYTTYSATASTTDHEPLTGDALDTAVNSRFQSYIQAYLRFNIEEPFDLKIPLKIEFIRLPRATLDGARMHFRDSTGWPVTSELREQRWDEGHNSMRYNYLIILDDETLTTLLNAPPAITTLPNTEDYFQTTKQEDNIVIKIVDVHYDESCDGEVLAISCRNFTKGSSDCVTCYGYIKTTPIWLQSLWVSLSDMGFKHVFKHKDVVYRGGDF
ncbi:hypothetical protein GLAREA_13049 [Glarea lozoyensis ATCC 20868]|uniref:Uncharacterized protein n=1 Tax=Glarea lozoyensis (strain ATCC 20868 / MF5171) TaxID=1116229 RepID=S3DEE7_GLAL2|nr:uncharacterized protein GLAREA_13049 [Glarea lozoyensis ATCC 20868]EPE30326.1 hypothetical protein GLAREA_13049 [Glarea lozoyensis ATCC 20868]